MGELIRACLEMLEKSEDGGVEKVGEFMEKVKDKDSGVRLMGLVIGFIKILIREQK